MKKIYRYFCYIIKTIVAKIISLFMYQKKPIWLICEKKSEARDNGYHMFKYIRENHPEVKVYYVISRNSADLHKIKCYGNIIFNESLKHYIYYFICKYDINSQPGGTAPAGIKLIEFILNVKLNKKAKLVFLQHGITKDELPHSEFDYVKKPYDLFVTAANREQKFILDTYGYTSRNAKLTGLARFDNLFDTKRKTRKQILIMPTFRSWLSLKDKTQVATETQMNEFKQSDYYIAYTELLNHPDFIKLLSDYGYEAIFYPHYGLQSFIGLFKENVKQDRVIIADRFSYDVQELMISSAMMVTDYSSVFFDFAYMNKPVVYYQFDKERFIKNHYSKGYFDYDEDGFGPVVNKCSEVIDIIRYELMNDMYVPEVYSNRVNEFFEYHDSDNCKRIYEAILKL